MGITSAIVLFAVIWFMLFLIILPLGLQTQSEAGEVVPGTHGSAPANVQIHVYHCKNCINMRIAFRTKQVAGGQL